MEISLKTLNNVMPPRSLRGHDNESNFQGYLNNKKELEKKKNIPELSKIAPILYEFLE